MLFTETTRDGAVLGPGFMPVLVPLTDVFVCWDGFFFLDPDQGFFLCTWEFCQYPETELLCLQNLPHHEK